MKTVGKKLGLAIMSFLASSALSVSACEGNLHLQLVSEWGALLDHISISNSAGDYLISEQTLEEAQSAYYNLTVVPGGHYFFYAHDTHYDMNLSLEFVPTYEEAMIDIIGFPSYYYEWGASLSSPTTYTISTSSSPSNGGSASGGGTKTCDALVTVSATPASGYGFVNWTEGSTVVSSTSDYEFAVTANRTLVAHFSPTTVSVSATLADAWESPENPGVFTITRSANEDILESPVTVHFSISGTATSGTDYPALGTQVTIPAGETSKTVYVWPTEDSSSESTETVILTLESSGNDYAIASPGTATVSIHNGSAPTLADPSIGSSSVTQLIYASANSVMPYPTTQHYSHYQTPSANYSIGRVVDISSTFPNPTGVLRDYGFNSFDLHGLPINGILDVPAGSGPFPLVLIEPEGVPSALLGDITLGYRYLCDSLASNGIIATAVNNDFLCDADATACMLIETIHQFQIWNETTGHPLYGKVDLNRMMLVGHCYGGLVAQKVHLVSDNPYKFKGMVLISPVDYGWTITDNLLVIQGSRDGVNPMANFLGSYEAGSPIDAGGFKSATWIIGADHHQFASYHDPEGSMLLSLTEQQKVSKIYVGAMARSVLLGQPEYLKFLKNNSVGASWLPSTGKYINQFQARNKAFLTSYGIGTFSWNSLSDYSRVSFSGGGLDTSGYGYLTLHIAQSSESNNPVNANQHVKVVVQDQNANSTSFAMSLVYPDNQVYSDPVQAMQTLRIPLNTIKTAGVNVNHISFIEITPDDISTGKVYFRDLELSN